MPKRPVWAWMTVLAATVLVADCTTLPSAEEESASATDSLAGIDIGRDWPNWRGPFCNGFAGDTGQELVATFKKAKLAWTSEAPFQPAYNYSRDEAPTWGFSDFAVVDGKLYYRYTEASGPVSPRSHELALQWLNERHGPEAPQHKRWTAEQIERLAEILGKVRGDDVLLCIDIDNGRTLWKTNFREMGLSQFHMMAKNYGTQGTPCVAYGKVYIMGANRVLYAMDQATGEPIWASDSNEQPVLFRTQYKVENERGRMLMRRGNPKMYMDDEAAAVDGCPMPIGGAIVVSTFSGGDQDSESDMAAVDAATGRPLWRHENCCGGTFMATPLRWIHQGREYAVSGYKSRTVCVEPLTGKLLWEQPGYANSKAMGAIAGDLLINSGEGWGKGRKHPIHCMEMSLTEPKMLWKVSQTDKPIRVFRYTAPTIYRDVIYMAGSHVSCLDLQTGKDIGFNAVVNGYNVLAADGVLVSDKKGLGRAGTDVKEVSPWSESPIQPEIDTVQVLVDGRLYVRGEKRLGCLDLRKNPPQDPEAQPDPELASDVQGLVAQLDHRYLAVRERAVSALIDKGAEAAPALAKALLGGSWMARQAAAEAIRRMGGEAAAVAPQLAAGLPSAVAEHHWGQVLALLDAVNAADSAALAPVVADIAAHLGSDHELVVLRACYALGGMGPVAAAATEALAELVAQDDAYLSAKAAEALGKIGPAAKAAAPTLVTAIDSEHGPVVAWALDALRQIGPPVDATDRLVARMWSPKVGLYDGKVAVMPEEFRIPVIAWQAGECLKAIGPSVVAPVVASLQGQEADKFNPTMAMKVLAAFPDQAKAHIDTIDQFVGKKNLFDKICLKIIKNHE